MTSNASNTTRAATDAVQEAPFDPSARQFDSAGRSFVDFHAALCGEPDEGDPVNAGISRCLKQGRSEAFCREYRKGYEGALRSVRSVAREGKFDRTEVVEAAGQLAHKAGEARAKDFLEALSEATIARAAGSLDARAEADAERAARPYRQDATPPTAQFDFGAAAAWAVGTPDFGQINTRIVTA